MVRVASDQAGSRRVLGPGVEGSSYPVTTDADDADDADDLYSVHAMIARPDFANLLYPLPSLFYLAVVRIIPLVNRRRSLS